MDVKLVLVGLTVIFTVLALVLVPRTDFIILIIITVTVLPTKVAYFVQPSASSFGSYVVGV